MLTDIMKDVDGHVKTLFFTVNFSIELSIFHVCQTFPEIDL